MVLRRAGLLLALCMVVLAGCEGDFDQRIDEAGTQGPGDGSTGSIVNPDSNFVRGFASTGGAVRNAVVTLRPINDDGSIDFTEAGLLGTGFTFSNGIYQVSLRRQYRGPILVEIRGQNTLAVPSDVGNPATARTEKFHPMNPGHVMYSVLPHYDGYSTGDTHVTPLTTVAVMRGLSFDGSIAGVQGGVGMGMFGLMCQQVARYFGLERIRAVSPTDFALSGGLPGSKNYSYVLAALSQAAKDLGVANINDFWLGMSQDAFDDGVLNGSIGYVPNTAVPMPDLSAASLIGDALFNNYLDPNNLERIPGTDNTEVTPGSTLGQLVTHLDTARDINAIALDYELTVRIPDDMTLTQGDIVYTRTTVLKRLGNGTNFHPFGDSGGPGFVEFDFVSSSPANVDVQPFGRIVVNPLAPDGDYTITLNVSPRAGQTFITGPSDSYSFNVRVR
jgi:hypothetical protein